MGARVGLCYSLKNPTSIGTKPFARGDNLFVGEEVVYSQRVFLCVREATVSDSVVFSTVGGDDSYRELSPPVGFSSKTHRGRQLRKGVVSLHCFFFT